MKKIISMALMLVMCLGLCACGENSKNYKSAVRHLEFFLEDSCWGYTESELREQCMLNNSSSYKLIRFFQKLLPNLCKRCFHVIIE